MTKLYDSPTHNTIGTIHVLSELPEKEIAEILEMCPQDPEATTCPEDEPLLTIGEIKEAESRLFTQITAYLSDVGMPHGQAALLVAIYATTVEDRVRLAMMS